MPDLAEPIVRVVKRFICPFCHRGRSTEKLAVDHIACCWKNPAVKSCRTCVNYTPADGGDDQSCTAGIDLTVLPETTGRYVATNCPEWVLNG